MTQKNNSHAGTPEDIDEDFFGESDEPAREEEPTDGHEPGSNPDGDAMVVSLKSSTHTGDDLGSVSNTILQAPYSKIGVSNLAKTVALLHSRGKGNEEHSRGLRVSVEEDAEMAIHALGFALRDIDWAKPA